MSIIIDLLIAQAAASSALAPAAPQSVIAPESLTSPPRKPGHPRQPIPLGNPGNWATMKDYPPAALSALRFGIVGFRLVVDRKGRVSSCEITSSSRWPDLDSATCALVSKRARFKPATDDSGKAATGSYSGRVRWMLPARTADLL